MQNWPNQMCISKTDALYLSKIWQFFSIHVERMRAPSKKDWIEAKIESIIVIEKKTEAVHEFTQWLCAECIKSSLAHVPLWETIKKQHSLGSRAVSICSSLPHQISFYRFLISVFFFLYLRWHGIWIKRSVETNIKKKLPSRSNFTKMNCTPSALFRYCLPIKGNFLLLLGTFRKYYSNPKSTQNSSSRWISETCCYFHAHCNAILTPWKYSPAA